MNRLTVKGLLTLKSAGLHADGGGLYLRIKSSGSRSWVFVYQWHGRRREKGLGSLESVSLAQARERRDIARKQIVDGFDPLEPAITSQVQTFGEVASALIADLELGWRNAKHRAQWRSTLETYCKSIWSRPVDGIGVNDVLAILRPIWTTKPETASRLRGRIERVLDAAKVKGQRIGDNPARWRGHLQLVLPVKIGGLAVRHHPAMSYDQVPDFVQALKTRISTAARALEFLIHTAARTGEVIRMTWREVDLDRGLWTVPPERMKMGREHVVPLTDPALTVVRSMAVIGMKPDAPVFPSRSGKPLSNMSMEMLLRRMGVDEATVHGFRSSFRDWVGDETDFPRDVVEMALAHQVGNVAERAYRRGTALAKRRQLMEAWSNYLQT